MAAAGGMLAAGSAEAASQCGKAAWYDLGGTTASGEPSNGSALAAAHRSLPFNTRVKVENLSNGRAVVVRINDRGPFVAGRIIDVTRAAAEKLGMINAGIARVRVTVVEGGGKAVLSDSCAGVAVAAAARSGGVDKPATKPKSAGAKPVRTAPLSVAYGETTPDDEEIQPATTDGAAGAAVPVSVEDIGTAPASEAPPRPADAPVAALAAEPDEPADTPAGTSTAGGVPAPRERPGVPADADVLPRVMTEGLARRFEDAFAPDYMTIGDQLPLGYAPVEGQ